MGQVVRVSGWRRPDSGGLAGFAARVVQLAGAFAIAAMLGLATVGGASAAPVNPGDPRVVALAAQLGNDPAQIFAWVRDQVGVEVYGGSLRGARGTLASKAGNALDRASLTVELLRAAGYTARYAQGTLGDADAKKLVAAMFANPLRMLGCYNPYPFYDYLNDPTLIGYAKTHYWVEYKPTPAAPYAAMDTAFAGASIGQAFASLQQNFDAVPDALQHKLRVRIDAETFSQAGAIYGFGFGTQTTLDRTFNTADLVDRPLTVGHFVASSAPPGLAITATTNTYSPYLVVGNAGADPRSYDVIRGSDYTELITNFPLGSTVLTGVFVNIDVIDPATPGTPQSYQRTLVDRVGYAARRQGGSIALDPAALTAPALTTLDLMTINASPSRQPLDGFAARGARLAALQTEMAGLLPQVDALPPQASQTPEQLALVGQAISLNRAATVAMLELAGTAFAGAADRGTDSLAALYIVKPLLASPRISIAQARPVGGELQIGLDIRKNDLRTYPLPGLSLVNARHFERARGLAESVLEGKVLADLTGKPRLDIAAVFAGQTDPAHYIALTPANAAAVDDLALSADAKARIAAAIAGNRVIIAPQQPVTVNGHPVTAWLESDPDTGYTISTFEDGTHGALAEYAALYANRFGEADLENQMAKFIGKVNALGVVGVAYTAGLVTAIASGEEFRDSFVAAKEIIEETFLLTIEPLMTFLRLTTADLEAKGGAGIALALIGGLLDGMDAFVKAIQLSLGDPPVPPILMAPPLPALPAITPPGGVPGVALTLTPDDRFVLPFNGAEFPTVYLARIRNTGPVADTFRLQYAGSDFPLNLQLAAPPVTIPPGATAELSACLLPVGTAPAPGSTRGFGVTAQSTTNGAVTQTQNGTVAFGPVSAMLLRVLPGATTANAGTVVNATLTLDSLSNTPTSVTLAAATSPGLAIGGLPGAVSLAIGESKSLPLSFTVGAGAASGSALLARITADFGGLEPAVANYVVNVSSPLTACVTASALAANGLGRTGLGASLSRLAGAMDALAAAPGDPARLQSVLLELQSIVAVQLNAPYLAAIAAPLDTQRSALAAAAPGAVAGILAQIDTTLCGMSAAFATAASNEYRLGLVPSVALNLPTQPTSVGINIFNETSLPRVFDVAVAGVPAGVTAVLNTATVTAPANYQTNGCCGAPPLTLTFTNANGQAKAFPYQVTVTPRDQPGAAKTTTGELVLRPDIVRIVDAVPTPAFGNAGTPVSVAVRVMNSANVARDVFLEWSVRDAANHQVAFGQPGPYPLASGDSVVTLPPFNINTTGFAEGPYTINLRLFDAAVCCDTIPGATGTATLLIGQPFSALLSVDPTSVPPGNSTVTMALDLSHDSAPTPQITLRSALAMPAATRSFARSGNYLYVCATDRISIVNTANPDALAIAGTFATDILAPGYGIVGCNVNGSTLVVGYSIDSASSFDNVKLDIYDIGGANATAPVRLNASTLDVGKRFGGGILFNGATGYLTTGIVIYNPFSGFIFEEHGNLVQLDFSNLAAPAFAGELYHHFSAADSNDPVYGGPNQMNAVILAGTKALVTGTNATAGDYFSPGIVGRINVIETSGLAANCPGAPNPCLEKFVDVPQAKILFGIAKQGNAAVAVGDTYGYYSGTSGLNGQLTVTALDIADPANPVVKSTLVTSLLDNLPQGTCNQNFDAGGTSLTALSNNFYAVGAYSGKSCSWVMAIIDANDPLHLRVIPYDVTDVLGSTILAGNLFYALTRTGILVYDYATLAGPAISAQVEVPKGTGVALVPGSFNLAPSAIDTSAGDRDRYTWTQPSLPTITWQQSVTAMQPGETRNVALGGRLGFTLPTLGSGSLPLAAVVVAADQSMSIAPTSGGAGLGKPATYTITIRNPGPTPLSYTLAVDGVPASWVKSLTNPVLVPANGQANATLVLQTTLGDPGFNYYFTVSGVTNTGFHASVQARFSTNGFDRDLGSDVLPPLYATTVTPSPAPANGGRGQKALVTLSTANTGTGPQQYAYYPGELPPGWNVTFDRTDVFVAADAYADIVASVAVPANAAPGPYDVGVDLYSSAAFYVGRFHFTVNVIAQGVAVALSPASGDAATPYVATITNTGTGQDTFDLTTLGPLGGAVTLDATVVTLAAGAAQPVAATIGGVGYLPPGTSSFDVQAISRTDGAARAKAGAQVAIAGAKAVVLTGIPSTITVPSAPSTRSFSLQLANLGNVEDAYALAIESTTGAIAAALKDGVGATVQSIAPLLLPGQSSGLVALQATLNGGLAGTVTVKAISQSDASVLATATLTLVTRAAAAVTPVPDAVDFGDQTVDTTSAVRTVALTNSGTAPFALSTIVKDGADAARFALGSGANACVAGGSLAADGGTCTLYLTFAPNATGARTAAVTLTDSVAGIAVTIPLSGNGVPAPVTCFEGPLPTGGTGKACIGGAAPACQFTSASFVPVDSVGVAPPAGVTLPYGLFRFTATGCGATATLVLTYPTPVANGAYWKYGPTAQAAAHWYSMPALIAGNTLTVTLTDGGVGDDDLAANGTIVDPGGAGFIAAPPPPPPAVATPIPALDAPLAALLALFLALAAWFNGVPRIQRRN